MEGPLPVVGHHRLPSDLGESAERCLFGGDGRCASPGVEPGEKWSAPVLYGAQRPPQGLDLVASGRPVAEVAAQLDVTAQSIYNWRNQDEVDRGLRAGVTTAESVELAVARKRIRALEIEVAVLQRANALLKEQTDPKGVSRSSPRS